MDPLKPPTSSKTVAEVCNLLRGDNLPEEDIIHALDALAAAVDFDPWGMKFSATPGSATAMGSTTSRSTTNTNSRATKTTARNSKGVRDNSLLV